MHKSKNIRVLDEQTIFCSKTKQGEVTMLVGILLKYLFFPDKFEGDCVVANDETWVPGAQQGWGSEAGLFSSY